MILLRCHILGFGKLGNCSFDFQNGLNLVFAPNEGGKSTLQRFLVGLLYGQLRSDLKVQRRVDPWIDQYKPWHGSEYGGILWCRLADGREMELHRYFGREETRIEIRSITGEDITRQYDQQRNGEVLFAVSHLGMPKGLFESVGIIRENKVAEIEGYETIRDRIANLAQSGDEELSTRQSLTNIQDKLDLVGSERAPTKPYKQAMDLVQAIQDERKEVDNRRAQFQVWIEERNRLAGEISYLERDLAKAHTALLSARRSEAAAKVQALEEIEKELGALRNEIESLGARADFPADRLEELNQLVGAQGSIEKHLNGVRSEKDAAFEQVTRAEAERKVLEAYGALAASTEAEKITEWFVSYLSLSLQKDGMQKVLNRMGEEARVLEERLKELSPALADAKVDWQRTVREAAEDEQTASQNSATLTDKISQEKSSLASAKRAALNRRIIAGAVLVLGAVSCYAWQMTEFGRLYPAYYIGSGIGCAAITGLLLFFALKSAKAGANAKQMLSHLQAELNSIREEGGKKRKRFNEVMKASGYSKLDDFLAAAKQSEQDRAKLADVQSRLAESERQQKRLQAQLDETYQLLKDSFAKVGLSCSPGNLKFQIDLLRTNLRRFRELDALYGSCVQKANALVSEDAALTDEYNGKRSRMQELLDQARVETPEKFRDECSKRHKLMELLDKEASRTREFQRLAGDLTLSQWKDNLRDLMEQPMPDVAEVQSETSDDSAPYLPYLPTIAEAEAQEKEIASRLSHVREEYARAMERTRHAFQGIRPSFEIDEDLAIAEQSFRELERNRLALETALDTISELSRQQQEVLAPQLNAAVEQRFLRLCSRRYEEVKVDPDFQVWVREAATGELRLAEHLSRGTQDQIYFSMRFGILDMVSKAEEPCPSLLDEPFAAYDRTRLGEAFEVLTAEAGRRQLILFTCREDLLDLAQQSHANIIRLSGGS
jgi:DNA repair exonuclease SbcCD ATPase subunit